MKNILFFLIFVSVFIKAQIITGTVLNENESTLQSVQVYIDGSSMVTNTNSEGQFSLNISNQKLGSLVFKKEGFETIIYPFNAENIKKLKVILTKESIIEEVKLLNYTDKNYERYINRFLNEFLGYSRENVKIKNPKDLIFAYDKENRILKAKAKKPLMIENKNLGYTVEYNLMGFSINDNQNISTYLGTSFFQEMDGSKKEKNKWIINRLNAYYGSAMHFFRSAYQNKIADEGYIVNRIVQFPNPKYPTANELKKLDNYRESIKKSPNNQRFLNIPADISDIQSRKNRESKFALALTEHKMPAEKFIFKENGRTYLKFNDLLGIVYKKHPYSWVKNKFEKATIPINMSSMIDTDGIVFEINSDGNYTEPDRLIFQDDWAKHKFSLLLPLDYEPIIK